MKLKPVQGKNVVGKKDRNDRGIKEMVSHHHFLPYDIFGRNAGKTRGGNTCTKSRDNTRNELQENVLLLLCSHYCNNTT
jgi:hypothetical protein